jgi:DNA modification methylase
MDLNVIYDEDCMVGLKRLPDSCIDCCITSPPYYGLRDYGVDGQIGLEDSPEEYLSKLVEIFTEVLRVLKPEGTLWLNIGDTYNGYKGNANQKNMETMYAGHRHQPTRKPNHGLESKGLKPKDLIGIPWMLAFSLRSVGYYLRQDIIWHKPNPMPEAVKDRCTKSHEYIFLLSKSARYYFDQDAIKEKAVSDNKPHMVHHRRIENGTYREKYSDYEIPASEYRNKRDVWTVAVRPSKMSHFATFPQQLIRDCVLAGCPVGGVILDPFMGTGTTAMVARMYGRNYIGYEINSEYFKYIKEKIQVEQDMFFGI